MNFRALMKLINELINVGTTTKLIKSDFNLLLNGYIIEWIFINKYIKVHIKDHPMVD